MKSQIQITGIAYYSNFALASNTTITFSKQGTGDVLSFNTSADGSFVADLPVGVWRSDKVITSETVTIS